MQTDFKVRPRPETIVLAKSLEVRLADLPSTIGSSFGEVYAYLGQRRAAAGEPFIVYWGRPGPGDAPFRIEISAPIDRPLDPPPGWACTTLPAGRFASVLHVGPYDTLGVAYDDLTAWIGRQGLAIAGPPREVYLSEPGTPPGETRTVVEFPVVGMEAPVAIASPT